MALERRNAWAYFRMSTDEQEDSPLTQGTMTSAFCEQQDVSWERTYFDLGISAATIGKRPHIRALIADAEREKPAYIVFYKLDRAFRNSEEQAVILRRLKKLGVKILKVRDPNIDGPQGELVDTILGAVNQFERELTGARIRDHNQAMAQRGEWTGGKPPFGYRYRKPVTETHGRKRTVVTPGGLEPDPAEWPIAVQLWQWAAGGVTNAEILQRASAAGWRKRDGNPWSFRSLAKMFVNKTYAGYVPFGHHKANRQTVSGEWYMGTHAPAVSTVDFDAVQIRRMQWPASKRRESRTPRSELPGLLVCGLCGGAVVSNSQTADGRFQYQCLGAADQRGDRHPNLSRRDWMIHQALYMVLAEALKRLQKKDPPDAEDGRRESAERDIARLQNQMRRMRDLYKIGEYNDDLAAYQRDKLGLEAQINQLQRELQASGPDVESLRRKHEELAAFPVSYAMTKGNVLARQRLWREFVERVELWPTHIRVTLVDDLGPNVVEREWEMALPPSRTRQPGSKAARGGMVGLRKDGQPARSPFDGITPRPISGVL